MPLAQELEQKIDTVIGQFSKSGPVSWLSTQVKSSRKALALRSLEGTLAKVITTANGHRKQNVKKHSAVYAALWLTAKDEIAAYCLKQDATFDDVYAQMPALKELELWAEPAPPKQSPIALTVLGVAAWVGGAFGIGVLIAVTEMFYKWGHHLIAR
jgi:hypothetical protein